MSIIECETVDSKRTHLCNNIHVVKPKVVALRFQKLVLIGAFWYDLSDIHAILDLRIDITIIQLIQMSVSGHIISIIYVIANQPRCYSIVLLQQH